MHNQQKTHPDIINDLLARNSLWSIPERIEPNHPSWQNAWNEADNLAKKNLARCWLWSTASFFRQRYGDCRIDHFTALLDSSLEWVQTVQPYLDAEFFKDTENDVEWLLLKGFLGYSDVAIDEHSVTLLSDFFFGTPAQNVRALLDIGADPEVINGCGKAAIRQAWRIASRDITNIGLVNAARQTTFFIGSIGALPEKDLAPHVQLCQNLGFHHIHINKELNDAVEASPAELLTLVRLEPPSVAASLLLPSVSRHYTGKAGSDTYFDPRSFLIQPLGCRDVFEVLKKWIPSRTQMLEHSENIGLTVVEACTLIANEESPQQALDSIDLPDDLQSLSITSLPGTMPV